MIKLVEDHGYRFGFNGMEADDEVNDKGNSYAFKYRIHDPRLGRFLSRDPLSADYPWNSSYAFAENSVVAGIDLEGSEFTLATLPGHASSPQLGPGTVDGDWTGSLEMTQQELNNLIGPDNVTGFYVQDMFFYAQIGRTKTGKLYFAGYRSEECDCDFNSKEAFISIKTGLGDIPYEPIVVPDVDPKPWPTINIEDNGMLSDAKFVAETVEMTIGGGQLLMASKKAIVGLRRGASQLFRKQTNSQKRAIRGLKEQLKIHKKKLKEYKKNPDKFDNKDFLKNAPDDATREKIINGRIESLENQIKTFEKDIRDIKSGVKEVLEKGADG
ncbi:MAG: hypothetical protein JJ975_15660 [Bacteroidia bacterium]|nr:hypothetical protein [Bacteroidia bacterium]